MPQNCETPIFIWQDPDSRWTEKVLNHVKVTDQELTVLHFTANTVIVDYGIPIVKYMLDLCYKFELLENERTTFLSYKDHLLALELCISRLKTKNVEIEAEVNSGEVIECHNAYVDKYLHPDKVSEKQQEILTAYEEFLTHSNCTDLWNLFSIFSRNMTTSETLKSHIASHQHLLLGVPESEIFVQFVDLLTEKGKKQIHRIIVETPLDASLEGSPRSQLSDSVNVSEQLLPIEELCVCKGSSLIDSSATEEYAEDIILGFSSLLVNCRNELALSKAMISPVIDLSHSAFTSLKRLSVEKEMPMCQTVISYVTRLKLGGKGYAPPVNCPLLRHLKALEQFVNLLNQLQTIIEEDMTGSAVRRVITLLKKRLLKSSNDKLKVTGIEDAARNLIETTARLHKQKSSVVKKSTQVGQDSIDTLHDLVNHKAYCYRSTDAVAIMEQKNIDRTPLNLPPLLGYFRSPEEDSCSSEDTQSSIHSIQKLPSNHTQDSAPVVSYFHTSESNSVSKSCVDENTPSKMTFKGCLPVTENAAEKEVRPGNEIKARQPLGLISNKNKLATKRSLLSDSSNEAPSKKSNTKSKKPSTAKLPKTKPQIKGQGQITNFFLKKS